MRESLAAGNPPAVRRCLPLRDYGGRPLCSPTYLPRDGRKARGLPAAHLSRPRGQRQADQDRSRRYRSTRGCAGGAGRHSAGRHAFLTTSLCRDFAMVGGSNPVPNNFPLQRFRNAENPPVWGLEPSRNPPVLGSVCHPEPWGTRLSKFRGHASRGPRKVERRCRTPVA